VEGTEDENEFDLVSRTLQITITTLSEMFPKGQEPVYKTPPLTRLTESAPSQRTN